MEDYFFLPPSLPSLLPSSSFFKTIYLQSGCFSKSVRSKFARELLGALPLLPSRPPLSHVLLVWPVSSLKSLERKDLEVKEVITAKGLNKEAMDMASVVTGANREK